MITIGEKSAESFLENPLGLLYSCHRRVSHFLNVLTRVTEAAGGSELDEGQRHAFASAQRYFKEAAPKHTLDEEDSLFPRLQSLQNRDIQPVMEKIKNLTQGHRDAEVDHQQVDQWVEQWLNEGTLPSDTFQKLSACLKRLDAFYQTHIEIEETLVFPLAGKWLSPAEIEAIGREMAIRRGLDPDALRQLTDDLKRPSG